MSDSYIRYLLLAHRPDGLVADTKLVGDGAMAIDRTARDAFHSYWQRKGYRITSELVTSKDALSVRNRRILEALHQAGASRQ